jgi:long-subunit acyl-CoA synthetase (AMP-forming)
MPADWKIWTWKEYYADSMAFAKSLVASGVPLFHVVNMIGFNSPEWVIANMGSILAVSLYYICLYYVCLYILCLYILCLYILCL